MNIVIVSGSHRMASQSEKIARIVQDYLQQANTHADIISLANNPIPLWEQAIWEGDAEWKARLDPLKAQLSAADGLVIISPEYHGQVPAGLKNFFLLFSRFELGHKPAYIISVSAGDGGAYPVAELRMSSYKNNRLCYIPEHLIIRKVESVFNALESDNDPRSQAYYQERLHWGLDILLGYAQALADMRTRTHIHHEKFGNGM